MNKRIITIIFTLLFSTVSLAQTDQPTHTDTDITYQNCISGSKNPTPMTQLEEYICELYVNAKEWVKHREQIPVPNLIKIQAINNAKANPPMLNAKNVSPTQAIAQV